LFRDQLESSSNAKNNENISNQPAIKLIQTEIHKLQSFISQKPQKEEEQEGKNKPNIFQIFF
jgi:hypothetical protein